MICNTLFRKKLGKQGKKMTTIYWAGDSTVKQNSIVTYPQTGIGQMMHRYTRLREVMIANHAENGRSTKQFIDEGRLARIYDRITKGDFLFIQFGHNDEKIADPARYADPQSDYPANIEKFVNVARDKGAYPVIITPLTRCRYASNAMLRHDAWAQAARETAKRLDVALIDLTAMSEQVVAQRGEEKAATTLYMSIPAGVYPAYPNGLEDGTHLQPLGAMTFAGLIARGLHELGGVYAELLCDGYEQWLAHDADQIAMIQEEGADERR